MTDKPKRHIEFKCTIGADSIETLIHALKSITFEVASGSVDCVSGASTQGYSFHLENNKEVTHESYFQAVDAWLAEHDHPTFTSL